MPTETPTQPLRHAWAVVKYNAQSGDTENTGDAALALIEPGIRLLELSAAYRAAHATYVEAVASERAAYLVSTNDPGLASAACTALAAAKQALLSAALDIT